MVQPIEMAMFRDERYEWTFEVSLMNDGFLIVFVAHPTGAEVWKTWEGVIGKAHAEEHLRAEFKIVNDDIGWA
jgi:hypothetical protein